MVSILVQRLVENAYVCHIELALFLLKIVHVRVGKSGMPRV